MTRTKQRVGSIAVFLAAVLAWLFVLPRLHVTTEIVQFLPDFADKQAARLTKSIAQGEIARTLILDLSGDPPEALAKSAQDLMGILRKDPATDRIRSGLDDTAQREVLELLQSRSPTAMLSPSDLDDDAIAGRLDLLKQRLGSPLGPFVRDLARRDPLGSTLGMLDRLVELDGNRLVSDRGVLFTADQKHAFVIAVTKGGSLDAPAQRAYLESVQLAAKQANVRHLEMSGIARMTVAAEHQIRGDIERIGTLSTVGIVVLFALLFRSIRMLGIGLVPLFFGAMIAMVATHVVFGEIHGLTLAFGTSLLGVGIDYAEHYFAHFALTPEHGADRVMHDVWPGLWMGAVTTIVGFAGLGLTGFPGVRQIAFFSAIAIIAALGATRWLLPPWMPAKYGRPRFLAWAFTWTQQAIAIVDRRRWMLLAPPIVGLLLLGGLLRTRFIDDVSVLLAFDPKLLAEDAAVRERLSPMDVGRFVVVVREKEEDALAALERTTAALDQARRDGLVTSYTPVGALLRSRATQRATFLRAKERRGAIEERMRASGFVTDAFKPFFDELDRDGPVLLELDDVRKSPLGDLVGALSPHVPEGQAFVIPLLGARDLGALRERLPDAVLVDEPSLLENTYRGVRTETLRMLGVGMFLVTLTLALRYRSRQLVLAALLPALLGAAAAVGFFGAIGTPLNLLHLVGLLLVLSMGVDFGIFVVEGRADPEAAAHSLVSITTATSTTLLSFGLLALSPSPALRALGSTITIGLLLAAAFCPLVSVMLVRRPSS